VLFRGQLWADRIYLAGEASTQEAP
jgi:hypothetical protein